MSHPKSPDLYDQLYHTLADLSDDELPLLIRASSRKSAEAMRFRWYGFLGALRLTQRPNLAQAARLELTITDLPDGSAELRVALRDMSFLAQVKAQLAAQGIARTPDQLLSASLTPAEQTRLDEDLKRLSDYQAIEVDRLEKHGANPVGFTDDLIMDILSKPAVGDRPKTPEEQLKADKWAALVKYDTEWSEGIRMNHDWDAAHPKAKARKTLKELLPKSQPLAELPSTGPIDSPEPIDSGIIKNIIPGEIDTSTPLFDYAAQRRLVDDK